MLSRLGLITLCALGAADAFAAPSPSPLTTPQQPAETSPDKPLAKSLRIAPHRAIYTMTLASVKNGSNITDVSGRMLFEWRDVCDGWAIQQHMQLHFTYTEGDDQDITSTELTWEAKNGKGYNFNIRRLTNGQETENYRGKAAQNANGTVSVVYSTPAGKTLQLPAGTLFPSAHTELILQNAVKMQTGGDKLFTRRVFDGSDETGSSDVSAFIMPQRSIEQEPGIDSKLQNNPLLADAAWPVHLAFFNIGTEIGEPDYEMDLTLLPNGIARHMKIDYGDFSVIGNLSDIESLPAQNCP
jgi:hypothetical protein